MITRLIETARPEITVSRFRKLVARFWAVPSRVSTSANAASEDGMETCKGSGCFTATPSHYEDLLGAGPEILSTPSYCPSPTAEG